MPSDQISLMLDSMFTAVEEGFSYDGIVSAPGRGLEDRPRLTVLLHDCVDLARMASMTILRRTTRPPHGHTGVYLVHQQLVVQVSAQPVENMIRARGVIRDTRPNVVTPEMDHKVHPSHREKVTQQDQPPVQDDGKGALQSLNNDTLRTCPRFHILVMGNTGVGKSSLIRTFFGLGNEEISQDSHELVDMDREFIAVKNGLFVLHDSPGLEEGASNMDRVKRFISDQRKKEKMTDRLHAIWLCLEVPYARGRFLEASVDEFLRNRREILGDIPIVVVLTKRDLLDELVLQNLHGEGIAFSSTEDVRSLLESRKSIFLNEHCTQPLLRVAGCDLPQVAVSTKSGYGLEATVSELTRVTTSEIERYIKADPFNAVGQPPRTIERNAPPRIVALIESKVDLTIAIGKKRYWSNLGASWRLSNAKVKDQLLIIHRNIIQVWDFNDPERDDSFKAALLDASTLGVHDIPDRGAVMAAVVQSTSALVPVINNNITAVIVSPLVATLTLVKLCQEVYKSSQAIAKRFMAYIIDLTHVMKTLFILTPQGSITPRDVALAFGIYSASMYRSRVHSELQDFSTSSVMLPGGRDAVVEKIEGLIRQFNITNEEVSRLRPQVDAVPRSSWYMSPSF